MILLLLSIFFSTSTSTFHFRGLVIAFWSIVFVESFSNPKQILHTEYQDGRSMFFVNNNSGEINPGKLCNLQISFKPDLGVSWKCSVNIPIE